MTIIVGSRVFHQNKEKSFGYGAVRRIEIKSNGYISVYVEWDTHRVNRQPPDCSHVSMDSLTEV